LLDAARVRHVPLTVRVLVAPVLALLQLVALNVSVGARLSHAAKNVANTRTMIAIRMPTPIAAAAAVGGLLRLQGNQGNI
jgi:hypothetical protein